MRSRPMLMHSWWIFALRGFTALMLAGFALFAPGVTMLSVIAVFAAYALLAGGVAVAGALRHRRSDRDWSVLLALGLVSILAGVLAILRPGLAMLALVTLIGANAMITGILEIVLAGRLRKEMTGEWLLIFSGAISLAFGFLLLAYPGSGVFVVVALIGVYALITGMLNLFLAYRAHRASQAKAGRRGLPPQTAPMQGVIESAPRTTPTLERRGGERRRVQRPASEPGFASDRQHRGPSGSPA